MVNIYVIIDIIFNLTLKIFYLWQFDLNISGTDEMDNNNIMNESKLVGALKQKIEMKHSNITDIETDNVMSRLGSDNSVKRKKKKKKHSESNEAEIIAVTTELESKNPTRKKNKNKDSYIHDTGNGR